MTVLVSYSSSDDEDSNIEAIRTSPTTKKRKLSSDDVKVRGPPAQVLRSCTAAPVLLSLGDDRSPAKSTADAIPSLPSDFLNLYSSTVRTTISDNPSLHGGRKRVTPHVEGHWAGHVFIEWYPEQPERCLLAQLISTMQDIIDVNITVHSLLENELDVQLPLHVSLSRPLNLTTETKDAFTSSVRAAIASSGVTSFIVRPIAVKWHANENQTRWFLVLQLGDCINGELKRLLWVCNEAARRFHQTELYSGTKLPSSQYPSIVPGETAIASNAVVPEGGFSQFHISIAWSLRAPAPRGGVSGGTYVYDDRSLLPTWEALRIPVGSVKIRIGQDVISIPLTLPRSRTRTSA